ncbi:MAG: CDP-alcohol phosphatidyltransferase family protein [Eubacterium sp.]|nr:CDP-alcohol phosphatidyltransferase family protein [Eubacterium sp.]
MKQIPNIISVFRILLVPVFIYYITIKNNVFAGVILGISGITDALDGFLARKFSWITDIGKIIDPVADKLTQIAVSIVFMIEYPGFWPVFAVLLLKEVAMILLVGLMITQGVSFKGAKWFGKITTVIFFLTMVGVLFLPGILNIDISEGVLLVLFIINLAFAVISALMYLPDFNEYRRSLKSGEISENKK